MYISPEIPRLWQPERLGSRSDLRILYEENLSDTIVSDFIIKVRGRWRLSLVYFFPDSPFDLVCRFIDDYSSEQKAVTYGAYFRRGSARDARGTLKLDENAFNLCVN